MNRPSEGAGIWVAMAAQSDLPAIVAVFLRCWRTSYIDLLTAPALAHYDEESAEKLWTRLMETVGPEESIVVAGADSTRQIAGVCRFDRSGYLASLYVDPDMQGAGLGRLLLGYAENCWSAVDITLARLWVFEGNHRARSFYERRGYRLSGLSRTDANYQEPEVQMIKRLVG